MAFTIVRNTGNEKVCDMIINKAIHFQSIVKSITLLFGLHLLLKLRVTERKQNAFMVK